MSLTTAVTNPAKRRMIAADAVNEAELAVAAIGGVRGNAARLGLNVINNLRPGFLQRHVHQILPALAKALDPYWEQGERQGNPSGYLEANADEIALKLLAVTDRHAAQASDSKASVVYNRLRPSAPERVAEHMPAIANFVARHVETAPVQGAQAEHQAQPAGANQRKQRQQDPEKVKRRERRMRRGLG